MAKNEESMLQEACVSWFRLQYKNILIWHTGNGGKRNLREAVKLKRMGVLAGVPDLFIPHAAKFCHGLFIELKSKNGVLGLNQKEIIKILKESGYRVEICKSINQFQFVVKDYLNN